MGNLLRLFLKYWVYFWVCFSRPRWKAQAVAEKLWEKKKALTMMEKLGKLEIWINMIDKNEYNKLTYLVNVIKDFLRRFVISKLVTDLHFTLQLCFSYGPFPNKHLVKERSNGNCIEKKADLLVNQQRMNNDRLCMSKQNMTYVSNWCNVKWLRFWFMTCFFILISQL